MLTIFVARDLRLYTHLSQSVEGTKFREKFYVDNYMNTYSSVNELITDKVILDDVMNEASMPLQEWVSNDANFNSLYNVVVPETQSVLGLSWKPITDGMNVVVGDELDQEASWRYTKRSILSLGSSIYDPLGWMSPLTVRGKMSRASDKCWLNTPTTTTTVERCVYKHCGRRKGIGMRNLILIK